MIRSSFNNNASTVLLMVIVIQFAQNLNLREHQKVKFWKCFWIGSEWAKKQGTSEWSLKQPTKSTLLRSIHERTRFDCWESKNIESRSTWVNQNTMFSLNIPWKANNSGSSRCCCCCCCYYGRFRGRMERTESHTRVDSNRLPESTLQQRFFSFSFFFLQFFVRK